MTLEEVIQVAAETAETYRCPLHWTSMGGEPWKS